MTIMSTQLGSTSILDNHKLQDSYNYVMGEQDDTCSQYKQLQDRTKGYNSDNQVNCEILLSDTMPTPLPTLRMPPLSPALPPKPRSPLWRPSSISPSDKRGDTAVQNEWPSSNNTLESGVGGPTGDEGVVESLRVESNHLETSECHSGIFFAFFRHFSTLFICIFLDFPICFMPIPFYFSRFLWPIILFNSYSLILSS